MASFADFIIRMERGEFDSPCVMPSHPVMSSHPTEPSSEPVRQSEMVGKYKTGDYCIGWVSGVMVYGAFVKIAQGGTGLLHRNEVDFFGRNSPAEFFFKGQSIDVKVVHVDSSAKISLAYDAAFRSEENRKCAIREGSVLDANSFLDVLRRHFSDFICKLMEGLESNGLTTRLCLPRDISTRMESAGDKKGLRFLEFLETKRKESFIVPADGVDYDSFLLGKASELGWHVLTRRTFAEHSEQYPWIGNCAGGERRVHPCVWNPKCICLPTLGLKIEESL